MYNKMVVLVLPCKDVEGGTLLQQDCQGKDQELAKEWHRLRRDARQKAATGQGAAASRGAAAQPAGERQPARPGSSSDTLSLHCIHFCQYLKGLLK